MGIETGRVAFLIFSSDRGQLWQFYISIGDHEISIGFFIPSLCGNHSLNRRLGTPCLPQITYGFSCSARTLCQTLPSIKEGMISLSSKKALTFDETPCFNDAQAGWSLQER